MVQLVYAPTVHLVAATVMRERALQRWATAHGYKEVADDEETPLGQILSDVEDTSDAIALSLDTLPEFGGRFCYRSFASGRSREDYVANIIEMEHGSVLEHSVVSFAVSGVSRSLTHELVRHRQGNSPSQESQRYVDAKDIRFVIPPLLVRVAEFASENYRDLLLGEFRGECEHALERYRFWQQVYSDFLGKPEGQHIKLGTMTKKRGLEAARASLPNAAETRILWTMNLRSARFVCALRGGEGADLEIRRLACVFTRQLKQAAPIIFSDFEVYTADDGFEAVRTTHPKV